MLEPSRSVRDKARQREIGAFYTPPAIADQLVRWAIQSRFDTVLDPSFGELAFLDAARRRLVELGAAPDDVGAQLSGVELDSDAFTSGARAFWARGDSPRLVHADFLDIVPDARLPPVGVVVGNPPFLRYQGFNERRVRAPRGLTIELSGLASSWALFLVHAVRFLADGGRLAHVLPAQFLHAQYAGAVREFLRTQFARITVIAFEERVFPSAQEEVVLICADGRGAGSTALEFRSVRNVDRLDVERLCASRARSPKGGSRGKLLTQLLPASTRRLYATAERDSRVARLGDLASVDIGTVTGANSFFLVTDAIARQYHSTLFAPAVGKAAHIAGARLTRADYVRLRQSDARCRLLLLDETVDRSTFVSLKEYLDSGEEQRLHERFKCRQRTPWWALKLPREPIPDLFLTYCAHEHPRLVLNEARVMHTNTLHGVVVSPAVSPRALAVGFYNSLTMLSAELLARSYGGGVLKLEPTEAEALLVPSPQFLNRVSRLLGEVDDAVRAGEVERAFDLVDPIVLERGLGLDDSMVDALRQGALRLRARRHARGRVARTL